MFGEHLEVAAVDIPVLAVAAEGEIVLVVVGAEVAQAQAEGTIIGHHDGDFPEVRTGSSLILRRSPRNW